jgi:glutamate---cysteine ligase / carboxylate-amine ligase
MNPTAPSLRLFAGLGIELEYMIVDAGSLDVRPISDELIRSECGAYQSYLDRGELSWSNELALHVVELKTNGPAAELAGVAERFQREVGRINDRLKKFGARLMPTAMHPWMDPHRETRLWPHDYSPVYEAFNRVFDCRSHGWSNLQSCHLNFPFGDDREFARLHAAVRLVLPILPALAASSPAQDGQITGYLDNRLRAYRTNCARIPSITGRVIPEAVFSPKDYETQILQRIYRDIAPFDLEGTLREEWLNARGAIARFERNTIEIRLLDMQECPRADLAIGAVVHAAVRALVEERWSHLTLQQSLPTERLEAILLATTDRAEAAVITDADFLRAWGQREPCPLTAGELWARVAADLGRDETAERNVWEKPLDLILRQGPLARRILRALGANPARQALLPVYARLCDSLAQGRLFEN